jgi:hypothetical protein
VVDPVALQAVTVLQTVEQEEVAPVTHATVQSVAVLVVHEDVDDVVLDVVCLDSVEVFGSLILVVLSGSLSVPVSSTGFEGQSPAEIPKTLIQGR